MSTRLLAVAAAVVLCAAPAAAQKKHALLVGVNTYDQPNQLPKLDFCQSDAQAMGELLEEKDYGYEVTVMTEQRALYLADIRARWEQLGSESVRVDF